MDRSFQLIRTNPRLTTNIKFVVDSKYNIYFESFDASKELSDKKYKHYLLNREAVLENELPKFYDALPKNIAFSPKTQFDADIMYNEYVYQFDNTYFAGANEVDDQWYNEEFEYFAPIYIKKGEIPKKFIILRVDDATIYDLVGGEYVVGKLDKTNFREEIIDKWKCISVFDLSNTTNVGKFFDRNINNNKRFSDFSFFFDVKKYNYSKWGGLDYKSGVYNVSEMFLDDKLYYSNPHYNFEEFITKGFEDNGLIYPYILNMKFLFDDSPASSTEFKKWGMNRYYGFYANDFELVKSVTSYELPELKQGLTIKNNIFLYNNSYINPYVLNYISNKWIQVDNDFYEVIKQPNGAFKIISDKNLTGYNVNSFNKSMCRIINGEGKNYITILSGTSYIDISNIDNYIDINGSTSNTYADIYLIEILGEYHILKKDSNGNHYIQTDYAIKSNKEFLQCWKGGTNNEYTINRSTLNTNDSPLVYNIYRVNLLDIKDFDFDRINTHYSDFDYEKSEYYETMEVKLSANEYRDTSIPTRFKTHDKGKDGQYKIMNISSEYTADDETFEVRSDSVTPMFEKNQSICKWSYDGSISHSDYPYKLNNNIKYGGTYNKTTNTELKSSNIKEKTLDYFYRIGELYGNDVSNIVTGFTSNYSDDWTVDTIGHDNWVTDHLNIYSQGSGSVKLRYNYPIIKNQLYSIEIQIYGVDNYVDGDYGVSSLSFLNGTSSVSGNTNISFIGMSLSTDFEIFSNESNIQIYYIRLTKIVDKLYLNQTTNIQTKLQEKYDSTYSGFNLKYYIESDFDYFDFFFRNNMYYEKSGKQYKKPYLKYSVFNGGDGDLPATTLFKGIEYKLYNVEDMVLNQKVGSIETIRNVITQGGGNFNGYKFSVILSEYYTPYKYDNIDGVYSNPIQLSGTNSSLSSSMLLLDSTSNGVNIFLNKKYKNVLVIINKNIPINNEFGTLNNVDEFGENYGLYNGKTLNGVNLLPLTNTGVTEYNPNDLAASYFTETLNNLNTKSVLNRNKYVCYYYIDEDKNLAKTEMIKFGESDKDFKHLSNWEKKFPPFYLETNTPNSIELKKNSFAVTPLKGPETNIYDKYLVYSDRRPLMQSYIDSPLSRKIEKYETDETINQITHGERIYNTNKINRFVGYYEPIFKNLSMFKPTYYWNSSGSIGSISGNYIFNDDLDDFATIEEMMYSKVNEYDNYLKLKNSESERSYFPMVDEIGLSQTSRFIFLSSWDKEFYIKTLNEQTLLTDYVSVPEQVLPDTAASAEILSSTITNITSFGNGMKIYGSGLSGYTLTHSVTIKNTSVSTKSFRIGMYYSNSVDNMTETTVIPSLSIDAGSTVSDTFNFSRPAEIKTGRSVYEEYILWAVNYRCYEVGGSEPLDSKTYTNFNVYNDLIGFTLSNPLVKFHSVPASNPLITNTTYIHTVDLNETNNLLLNISFDAELSMSTLTIDPVFISLKNLSSTVTDNTTINFGTIILNKSDFLLGYDDITSSTIKYDISHGYFIEGVEQFITGTTELTSYNLQGEPTPPPVLGPPVNVSIRDDSTSSVAIVHVTWEAGTGSATGYEISRSANYGAYAIIDITGNFLVYDDYTVNWETIYTYKIKAKDNIGNWSILSASSNEIEVRAECFIKGTLITMSNGDKIPIEKLSISDDVLSANIFTLNDTNNISELYEWNSPELNINMVTSKVTFIYPYTINKTIVINNGLIEATPKHNQLVQRNEMWKFIPMGDIVIGDKLYDINNNVIDVEDVEINNKEQVVYRLTLSSNSHTFFANNTLTHNIKAP